jgi:hypothetical protein
MESDHTIDPNLAAFGEMFRQMMEYQTRVQEDIRRGLAQLRHEINRRDDLGNHKKSHADTPWPTFTAGDNDNLRLWTQLMEIALRVHGINPSDHVDSAVLCLKGRALQWFMTLPRLENGSPFTNWIDFRTAII